MTDHRVRARAIAATTGVLLLLVVGVAQAAGGKGDPAGKGASGPSAGPTSHEGGSPVGEAPTDRISAGGVLAEGVERKRWTVDAVWELHRLVRQRDLGGAASNKTANFLYAIGRYEITDYDRVSIRAGFSERFLADQEETGLRFNDIVLSYTRRVPLPEKLTLRISPSVELPTSYSSIKLTSLYFGARLGLALDRSFGDLDLILGVRGDRYFNKYDTAVGGNPNTKWIFAQTLTAEYHMPFHRALSAGALVANEYIWLYRVGSASPLPNGVMADPQYGTSQPMEQAYGGEIFVRYHFPRWKGFDAVLHLAFAQGDPTLGYTSRLHDGGSHTYLFYRRTSEVYSALSVLF